MISFQDLTQGKFSASHRSEHQAGEYHPEQSDRAATAKLRENCILKAPRFS
jgi:hypothetical protein